MQANPSFFFSFSRLHFPGLLRISFARIILILISQLGKGRMESKGKLKGEMAFLPTVSYD